MNLEELRMMAQQEGERQAEFTHRVIVCTGTACQAAGSAALIDALAASAAAHDAAGRCAITGGGCRGLCAAGPMVTVEPSGVVYERVRPADAGLILDHLDEAAPLPQRDINAAFFSKQKQIVLEHNGALDPDRIEAYVAAGGFQTLLVALFERSPAEVTALIAQSGLAGRGGAGYPTGLKWSTVAKAPGAHKIVICNGDEGDPGAFMDRSIMEAAPFRVIEGMMIAAYAVGADEGYIYVRAEYPLAIKRLKGAIRAAEKLGLLGLNICGTSFSFKLEVRLGAGAFVCGEETALIASIEGRRGTPRPRPPYPAESGLWGRPTLINNVETFANVVPILREGADWFAAIGTARSKGTKVFALSGQIVNTGLIEVPMGITLREIIYEIGGGIPNGRRFKAVQTGGPSGGCIPEAYLDMPVDYESLVKAGSIMGSGGMIVMDESSCMVDVAKYFMEFCMSESCGKCVPCRVGTAQMAHLLGKITRGEGELSDLDLLETLSEMVGRTSLCGLGQAAPNPLRSTLRYFRDEYLAHIVDKVCPAGVCTALAHKETAT